MASGIGPAMAIFVIEEALVGIGRDTGIEGVSLAQEYVDEPHGGSIAGEMFSSGLIGCCLCCGATQK